MNKLIVISLDALGNIDEETYSKMPFLSKMIKKGYWIKNLKTIYPTVTYPIHTSMITGVRPIDHGVDNNLLLQPEKLAMDWFWDYKYVKVDSIFTAAKRKGLKIASFSWPVTVNADIDYNFPEIGNTYGMEFAEYVSSQSDSKYIEELFKNFGEVTPDQQPDYDEFLARSAAYTLNKYKPDLLFLHLINIDSKKHVYGSKHLAIDYAIKDLDARLKRFFQEISKENNLDNTNVVFISDHSQIDVFKSIKINKILEDMDLLEANEDGSTKDYKAFFLTNGGSAALYLKDKDDKETLEKIINKLKELNIEEVEKIIYKDEIEKLGASKDAVLWLEAKEGYIFDSQLGENLISKNNTKNHGNHEYLPDKNNYDAIAICVGPNFKEETILEKESILNIAGTINKVMDLELESKNKNYIKEIIK